MKNHIKLYEEYSTDSQFFKTREEIEDWLGNFGIEKYTMNKDLTVDSEGDVVLRDFGLKKIPVKFGKINRRFYINGNELTGLKGSPYYVGGDFQCGKNKLTSLEYCPTYVGGDFFCSSNKLTSYVFVPKEPFLFFNNPCDEIYANLGFTTSAHVEALLLLDPNPKETLMKLKNVYKERYLDIISDCENLRKLVEDDDLTTAYNNSKTRGEDFY